MRPLCHFTCPFLQTFSFLFFFFSPSRGGDSDRLFSRNQNLCRYWPSYLWVNFWLVLYTWLQHTAPDLPHFGEDEWTWVRGALCTIDRPYGPFDWMHHHIGSTHVAHHLFSYLPCYHAVEATAALKAFLEPKGLYHYDATPFPVAAWKIGHECHYVEDVAGVQFYKSLKHAKSGKAKKSE